MFWAPASQRVIIFMATCRLIIALHLLLLLFSTSGFKIDDVSNRVIKFLNHEFTLEEWVHHQTKLLHATTQGKWVDAWSVPHFKPIFSKPCIPEKPGFFKYITGPCLQSNSFRGYHYFWQHTPTLLSSSTSSDILPQSNHAASARVLHTSHSNLLPWDAMVMCRVAQGRHIMLLGDSMQEQLFLTWVSGALAYAVLPKSKASDDSYIKALKAHLYSSCDGLCPYNQKTPCEGPFKMPCGDGVPSYTLSFAKVLHLAPLDEAGNEHAWMTRLKSLNISLLLVNSGAHYLPTEPFIKNLDQFLDYVYHHLPGMSVIYRDTPSGHPGCDAHVHDVPLEQNVKYPNEANPKIVIHPEYHWDEILAQNADVHKLLAMKYPQVLYVDVATSTMLRHDSHPSGDDCLHYCLAGPVDNWLVFHYNALLRLTGYIEEVESLYSSTLSDMVYVPTPSPLTTVLPWVSLNNSDSEGNDNAITVSNSEAATEQVKYGVLSDNGDIYAFHDGKRHFCGRATEVVLSPADTEAMSHWRLGMWDAINSPGDRPERTAACDPDKANKS